MNRPIKFRAWDKEEKEYYYDAEYTYDFLCSGRGCYADSFGEVLEHPERYEIEQYTGLKDKNGKEIYEGDIVKCWSQDTYPVGRVMYSEEWCGYEIVSYDPKDCRVYNLESFSPTVNKYLEVIGNIHENPELLEKGERS